MHVIETINVEYQYPGGTRALRGVDLGIKSGSKVTILGPNGAGKSTLLYLFNATLRPTSGEVLLNGSPMRYNSSSLRQIRKTVGMVFPNPDDQLFAPTVKQDVSFGPLNLKLSKEEVEERVSESLQLVGISELESMPPHHLSTGQKKRAAIAGVLAMDPNILVFDEPLSGLDPTGQADMIELLDQLNADGKTIIVSTHRMEFAADWADNILVIKDGKVIKEGVPEEIFSDLALIHDASLQVPVPIQTHNELRLRGFNYEQTPLSVLELVESVVSIINDNGYQDLSTASNGVIWIVRTPRAVEGGVEMMPPDIVQYLVDIRKPHKIGAMGTVAKSIVINSGLRYDFGTEVVNNSVSASLRGLSTMIFATGTMAELAVDRIAQLNLRLNKKMECHMIDEYNPLVILG